jgi:two-component system, OmpR family, phosphate regulon sensor histidine kinase PhoR
VSPVTQAVLPAGATTLVIDDEAVVRHLVRRMLEPDVCRVVEASDGETGLRLIEQSGGGIDAVLTDLLMPGIDGYDVVEVLTSHRPELPVACMSGFTSHASAGRRILVPYIAKPFGIDGLRDAVASLLNRSRALRESARADRSRAAEERAISRALCRRGEAARAEAIDLVAAALELRRQRAEGPRTR